MALIKEELRERLSFATMAQPIAEIEELAKHSGENLHQPWPGDIIAYIQHKVPIYRDMVLISAHSNVSSAMLKGIEDTVRTRILDYVLAIQAADPKADEASPHGPAPIPIATLHQTFNTTIINGQANIGGQGDQEISGTNKTQMKLDSENKYVDAQLIQLINSLKSEAEKLYGHDREESQFALKQIETQLSTPEPKLEKVRAYLDILTKIGALAPTALKAYEHIRHLF